MSANPNLVSNIHWVQGELTSSLTRVRGLIEQHMEKPNEPLPLQQALVELHQLRGTAAMIQCAGVAAVAEEMKALLQDLLQGRVQEAEAAYAGLLGAIVQVGDYIDALASGLEDCVLVFQPAVNELRLARGKGVLSEAELFAEQFAVSGAATVLPPSATRLPKAAQVLAKKYLLVFQQNLLFWLKGQEVQLALGRIGKIGDQVAACATSVPVYLLWRATAAVAEAVLTKGLDDSSELKRLFGRAGAQLKALAEQGEEAAAGAMGTLPYQLLFAIGRSRGQGPRATALKSAYPAVRDLPSAEAVETLRQKVRGANTTLLTRLSEEIRRDLAQVKDQIDLAVRTHDQGIDFGETAKKLQRVAMTLSMLGLGPLQGMIQNNAQRLATLKAGTPATDPVWIEVATALLRVEHSLDDALFRQLRRARPEAAAAHEGVPLMDVREGQDALVREALVDLSKLKGDVDKFIKSNDNSGLKEAATLLGHIEAGLRVLGVDRASLLTGELRRFVASPSFDAVRTSAEQADRFADAVACIEFFLESMQKHEPDSARIIDNLARCVEQLEIPEAEAAPAPAPPPPPPEPAAKKPVVEVDPEIRDIFLEEAAEVLELLRTRVPEIKKDPKHREALIEVRRGFHTLKGSGRMVGATDIGEFAWSVENLLNRCIEGARDLSPEVMQVVDDAISLLPSMADAFRDGLPAPPEAAEPMARAHRMAKGGDIGGPDKELLSVFTNDARERINALDAWLGGQAGQEPGHVHKDLLRALHTLAGSASLVNAQGVGQLSAALERYLEIVRAAKMPLKKPGIALIAEAAPALKEWVERVARGDPTEPDLKPWLRRLAALESELPAATREARDSVAAPDVFANEAFTQIEAIEREAGKWAQHPEMPYHPKEMQNRFQRLHGDAVTAQCAPLGHVAQAFEQRMNEFVGGDVTPDAAFFKRLHELIEGMYQQLDAFRENNLVEDGSELAAQVFQLEASAGGAEALPADEVIDVPPVTAEVAAPEMPAAPAEPAVMAPEEAIDVPPVESETPEPAAPEPEPVAAPEVEVAEAPAAPEAIEMPPVESLDAGVDPELIAIFLAEGEELLEVLDQQFDAWERAPKSAEPMAEVARALHTMKGSARMANLGPVADVSHRMESLLESVGRGAVPRDAALFARLRNAVDGLHHLLDDAKANRPLNAEGVLRELDTATEASTAPKPAAAAAPVGAASPAMRELPREEVAAKAAPTSVEAAPAAPAVEPPPGYDSELVEVFTSEAAELLDALESSVAQWQANPGDSEGLREAQRALHTLKGGARMAGLMAMGTAAHDMESRVEKLAEGRGAPDAATFAALHSHLERLQRMHDRLVRGEAMELSQETLPSGLEVAPEVVAPEPQVEEYEEPEAPAAPEVAAEAAPAPSQSPWDPALFWKPESEADALAALRRETARVPVEQLDKMLNEAGEISIFRARLEQYQTALSFQLGEMQQTIQRVRDQLRAMDLETEAQIAARGFSAGVDMKEKYAEFDPLEMDRYSRMQELSRALAESVGDLGSLHTTMGDQVSEAEALLLQQSRVNTEVQQGLMRTLMVPFSRQVQRLQRVVRQTAQETGKQADVKFEGIEQEMDRNVLDRMTAPMEHLLRNSVVHGIEDPATRETRGKEAMGQIRVELKREGTQLVIEVSDDGKGLDYAAIRRTAIEKGLMEKGAKLSDQEVAMFIFEAGFSTAKELTQSAGRGVGMDVVAAEVKQLGGSLELFSKTGAGARFVIRLPLTLALAQALLVGVGNETYAVPLTAVESIARIPRATVKEYAREGGPPLVFGGHEYRVRYLGDFVDAPPHDVPEETKTVPAVLVRFGEVLGGGERRVAVVVDALLGHREIVSKAVGPQVSSVQGVAGATILPDGRVVLILDLPALAVNRGRRTAVAEAAHVEIAPTPLADERLTIMVVDDSITIRRVTERLLTRQGYRVLTAKDGLDAIAQLQTESPNVILLDIEMPRADGFEVATFIRGNERLKEVPIIMITSRSGEKHRERAKQIGVNRYVIKPYQEEQLMSEVRGVLGK